MNRQAEVSQQVVVAQKKLDLLQQQEQLAKQWDQIETEIQLIESGKTTQVKSGRKVGNSIKRSPGRPKGSKNKPKVDAASASASTEKRGPGRPKGSKNKPKVGTSEPKTSETQRARNEKSLSVVCLEVLKGKKGLKLPEIVEAVLKSGYKSNTKGDFSQIVYQTLYKLIKSEEIVRDEEAMAYSLKAA
jgi:TolA-binding protein